MSSGLTTQGKIAGEVHAIDWATRRLGPIELWPDMLVLSVNLCLGAPFPSLVFWGEEHHVFYNDAYDLFMGNYEAHQVMGRPAEVCLPDLWEWVGARVREVKHTGRVFESQDMILAEDFPALWTLTPLMAAQGEPKGVMSTWSTDLRRMERQHQRWRTSEEALRERIGRFESITDGFLAVDDQWLITYVSPNTQSMARWPVDGVIGARYWEVFEALIGTPLEVQLRRAAANGETVVVDAHYADWGQWFEIKAYPSADGGLAMLFTDVSQRKDVEIALVESEARFRAVAENAVDTIAITDARGLFSYVSASASEVLGYDARELIGRSFFDFLPDHEIHHLRNEFTQLVHQPGSVASLSFGFEHKSGIASHLAIKAKNLLAVPGVDGILLNIRDASESHRVEAQLRQAKEDAEELTRLKSSLLASMSHEIRTPLTSILGLASLVAQQVPEEFRDSMRLIERGGARLADTLNSVLLLAQFESDAVSVEFERVNVVDEVEEIARSLQLLAQERGLYLSVLAATPHVHARVDRAFFDRILNNLIGNAIKFTNEGGVTVEVNPVGERVEISVCDTGIGIDPDFFPHLFEEFKQENSDLAGSSEGSGLGLAITKRLVKALGGSIEVRSKHGEGSIFTVSFGQVGVAEAGISPAASDESLDSTVRGISAELNVLVVEDNEAIRSLVRQQLETVCQVTVCTDAESALECAREHDFDVIFMDISLPGMDGIEAVARLRAM
ncbi:MAG: PAS domain-containing protein [Bradymonadaceae bacterium]|nr:PAS domain-containing protein [Lujinxingiaceae bacterium]